jgi:hypothetical protein
LFLSDASATLDATNTALNYLRADYEREQAEISERKREKREKWEKWVSGNSFLTPLTTN